MPPRWRQLAALAAALLRGDADRIVGRVAGAIGRQAAALARELSLRPREARLAELSEALDARADGPRTRTTGLAPAWLRRSLPRDGSGRAPATPSATRTPVRSEAAQPGAFEAPAGRHAAWKDVSRMPLPLTLPALSRGYALLGPSARAIGARTAEAIAASLVRHLAVPVKVSGRASPGPFTPSVGAARVALALEDPPGLALVEVDVAFLARILGRLAGTPARIPAALAPTAGERSLLDLLVLVALDAAAEAGPEGPRMRLAEADAVPAPDALAVALDLEIAGEHGSARLALPPAAVAALSRDGAGPTPEAAALPVGASLREGTCTLSSADLSALAPGDVLLLDEGPPPSALVLPGGFGIAGRLEGDLFHVQETLMTETQAAYPISLAVEIARVTVTLGDLARLEPGAALPLDIRRDGTVVLRAGERVLARGQLVEIDGALGVRVAELGEAR